ncbi:MAG: alpha/beta fold hydrolase [Spirosomataceae bacterium]
MQESYHSYYSHILGKEIEFMVSGHWGYPILLFPTSMGNTYQNRDFGLIHTIEDLIEAGKVKVYSVDSIDFQSFYNKELPPNIKIYNYNLYTRFLHEEFVPMIQRTCQVHRIAVAGCSFGGFHAANYAFKYPDTVNQLISMSGAFSISSFMNGYFDDNVYFNNPVDYLPKRDSWIYDHMQIILGTSDWDICRQDNLSLSHLLAGKGIDHWFDEKKWAPHDWPLWRTMFPEYVRSFIH